MKIDNIENIITPVGFMHIDTEGWEIEVLKGSHNILNNKKNNFILICECWTDNVADREKKIGRTSNIMSNTPENDILKLINKYKFEKLENIIDNECNLVFKIN